MLFGGMGVVEGPHRVPSTVMLDEQHDRVLNRMSAGALNHDAHVASNATAARPILRHTSDDPNRCGE
jgi:hypothetical protein